MESKEMLPVQIDRNNCKSPLQKLQRRFTKGYN